jgi:hypothetical protein
MLVTQPERTPELPELIPNDDDDGDRPSITEVNGTIARFEMAYNPNPTDRFFFGPTLAQRVPSLVFLFVAVVMGASVLIASNAPQSSGMYHWAMDGAKRPLAIFIFTIAIVYFFQTSLRGVVVTRDAIEARYLLAFGFPRVAKWSWAQVDRLVMDDEDVLLELWDGTYERLPRVKENKKLIELLHRVALARGRQITRVPAETGKHVKRR